MEHSSVLLQLGQSALAHQEALEVVKSRVGITHNFFDCWIYGFLENKNFDIEETVAKLIRRDAMERNELAGYEITDYMRETMSKGIIQLIGDDKEGRVTFYIVTNRDRPTAKRREENKRNFDMWVSYGARLRKENLKCRITMLINQEDASMWANTDMTFQADVALRIAKYYPGVVDRMYICKMNRTLSALAKPIFTRLPKVVSERIRIITESDLEKGKLFEYFDESVLPVALGGRNPCDAPTNWKNFENTVCRYFTQMRAAVSEGQSVKEWELATLQQEEGCERSVSQTNSPVKQSPVTHTHFEQPHHHHHRSSPGLGPRELNFSTTPRLRLDESEGSDEGDLETMEYDPNAEVEMEVLTGVNNPSKTFTFGNSAAVSIDEWADNIRRTQHRPDQSDALLLVEQYETTLRQMLGETETMHFFYIMDQWTPPANASDHGAGENQLLIGSGSRNFLSHFPAPLRSIIRGALWVVCVVMAFYFLMGVVFAVSFGCGAMALFFFGMMSWPYAVYPYGFAVLVVGYQTCAISSRGFELVRTAFRGRLMHFLRPFGLRRGLKIQVILFFAVTLALFIVFCYYAATIDPLSGLQYSVSCGWIVGSAFVLLYHLVFPLSINDQFGPCNSASKSLEASYSGKKVNNNIGAVSLYLFLDLSEDDPTQEDTTTIRDAVLSCGVPVSLAILAGVAFMISTHVVFIVACIVCSTASVFATNFITETSATEHSTTLLRVSVVFTALGWVYTVVVSGMFGSRDQWGGSVAVFVSTAVAWVLIAVGSGHLGKPKLRRWLFRVGWLMLIANIVVATVLLFTTTYRVGVFVLVLFLHSAGCFFRRLALSKVGQLLTTAGFLAIICAAFILGMSPDASGDNVAPMSSSLTWQNYSFSSNATYHGLPEFTACLSRFPAALDVVAMSMFSAITYGTAEFRATDLHGLFPTYVERPSNAIASQILQSDESFVSVFMYEDLTEDNSTVVVFRNVPIKDSSDEYALVEGVTLWTEAMSFALAPLIIPAEWIVRAMNVMSFVSVQMVPDLRSQTLLEDLTRATQHFLLNELRTAHVYFVGHDEAGGIAAILGSKFSVETVTFGAPGPLMKSRVFGGTYDTVISVVTDPGSLSMIGGYELEKKVSLPCDRTTATCRRAHTFVDLLNTACKRH